MATKTLKSIKGRVMRLTKLDICGNPVTGACSSIVSSGFITVTPNMVYEEGTEIIRKNAWGALCINHKDAPELKRVEVVTEFTDVDPDVMTFMAGGSPVTDGTNTIGNTYGPTVAGGGYAMEVWTKQLGQCGTSPEWGYFVVPFIINGRMTSPPVIQNDALTLGVTGEGQQATDAWGVTPYDDNPFLAEDGFPEGEFWGLVRTTVQPPAVTAGCVALS